MIFSKKITFLNKTIQSVLEHHHFAFKIIDEEMDKLMGYTLPIICLEDIILEKEMVVEFLADICLGHMHIR